MSDSLVLSPIAHIKNDLKEKFGVPRQSGLVQQLESKIIFTQEFRNPDALRGIEGFSHLWLIWEFSRHRDAGFSPTVRPPRLGGNARVGVFATRSPFRPNPLGLSCVQLGAVDLHTSQGPVLTVMGADLLCGTPIFDIKPYLPYADCKPEAAGGFAAAPKCACLQVDIPPQLASQIPAALLDPLRGVLAQDPRPAFHSDPARVYTMRFGEFEVSFQVSEQILYVCKIAAH